MDEEIYAQLTKGVHKPKKHKIALFLCGSSGTGKTTTKQKILNDSGLKGTYVDLNIDSVTQMIGSRQKASQLFGYLIRKTIEDEYSFIYDGTCRDKGSMTRRINSAKQKGYRVIMGITYTTLDTALKRIIDRTEQPVPENIAREIYQQVENVAEGFMKSTNIDEVYLYNNEHTSTLIFHKAKKAIKCLHSDMDFYFDVSNYC
jgi:predicted ABC-type ATPase